MAKGSSKVGTKELERICGGRLQALNACFQNGLYRSSNTARSFILAFPRVLVATRYLGQDVQGLSSGTCPLLT